MAYTPNTWVNGNTVTAALLNKIEAGIASVPASFVKSAGSGVSNSTAIQAAIDERAAAAKFGVVVLEGDFGVGTTINLKGGVQLVGGGGYDAASQPGTTLRALGTLSGPVLKYTEPSAGVLWHHGGLERLRIRDAPAGHGIHILGGMGEGTVIDQVMVSGCSGDGLRIEGASTPSHIGHFAPHSNGGAGLRLVSQTETHTQILYLGGDNNAESLLTIDSLSTTSSVQVGGWKAERWNNGTPGHTDVFVINNGNGALIDLGMGRVHIGSGVATSSGAIVKQTATGGNSVARVRITPVLHTDSGTYTNGYNDTANTITYTVTDILRQDTFIGMPPRFLTPNNAAAFQVGRSTDSPGLYWYTATPEAVITANPGSLCFATNGTIYQKYTGTGNAGWRTVLGVNVFGAKGSLIAGSGSTAGGNFSAGSDFTVLSADSTQTFGLRWNPSGGRNYDNTSRPAASAVPIGTMIYNTQTSKPNWSDGTSWRDAAGTVV